MQQRKDPYWLTNHPIVSFIIEPIGGVLIGGVHRQSRFAEDSRAFCSRDEAVSLGSLGQVEGWIRSVQEAQRDAEASVDAHQRVGGQSLLGLGSGNQAQAKSGE